MPLSVERVMVRDIAEMDQVTMQEMAQMERAAVQLNNSAAALEAVEEQ
jgi:hypothetical protein